MAASDNVVRAGLTPKFKDVKVLVDMLTYRYGSAKSQLMTGSKFGPHSLLYDPPIDEFSVILTSLNANVSEKHPGISGPSIFIVTRGEGSLLAESLKTETEFSLEVGYVYFVGANVPVSFEAGQKGLEIYRAFTVPTWTRSSLSSFFPMTDHNRIVTAFPARVLSSKFFRNAKNN